VKGGQYRFEVIVNDAGFSPTSIFAVQNYATVDLTLTNQGSIDRGFVVECMPTPNDDGCAQEACVRGASIEPIPPGSSESIQFTVPAVEGLFDVTTGVAGDAVSGQFIIQ
jgi:hypothetical protein